MADFDVAVVGAGVVGLAIGAQLARAGLSTAILDAERTFGTGTSSRNSEVIHAGLYYAGTPLKAELCVRGKALLYRFCETYGVPHRRIGKLVFAASPEQNETLDRIAASADGAGVHDLERLTARDAARIEPALASAGALLSPSTGIIDSHSYMQTLLALAEGAGAEFYGLSAVSRLSREASGWGVHLDGEEAEPVLTATRVVNAAGLTAHLLAARTEGLEEAFVPRMRYARGNYFAYEGRMPFERLIYPVPVPGGLGTHLTFDIGGAARFGPDVEWIDEIGYGVDPSRKAAFVEAARRIWPEIDPDRVVPAYSGIRPKIVHPDGAVPDFVIDGPETHKQDGLVNLFGIESPGLTASLAIAEAVERKLAAAA